MPSHEIGRRQFLLTAAGAALLPRLVSADGGVVRLAGVAPSYDPNARFAISVSEVDVLKNVAGRMLEARIYRPNGPGPFPKALDLHGAYKAAGGSVDYHVFEGSEHQWVAQPGPETDKARPMVKAFTARQLKSKS